MAQELFVIRNNQANDEKFKNLENSFKRLADLVDSRTSTGSTEIPPTSGTSSQPNVSPPTAMSSPRVSPTNTTTLNGASKASSKSSSETASGQPKPENRPKILFVGDSISNHADFKVLAEATKSEIVSAKAYSAVYDDVTNKVKDAAYYPRKNFLQVVPNEAIKDNFEHMVVQTGSVDISNLKVDVNPEDHLEYFRQEAVMSARNIFDSCLLALDRQPSLKTVVIMKQTPRYDPLSVDPLSIRPALSRLFNNTLTELWISCPLKNKIYIGTHNIDCTGAIQSARYRHTKTGRFDGVHLYGTTGSKAYTKSVLNILASASLISAEKDFHLSCPQYKYQNRQSRRQGN